jgi:hypothetical protein
MESDLACIENVYDSLTEWIKEINPEPDLLLPHVAYLKEICQKCQDRYAYELPEPLQKIIMIVPPDYDGPINDRFPVWENVKNEYYVRELVGKALVRSNEPAKSLAGVYVEGAIPTEDLKGLFQETEVVIGYRFRKNIVTKSSRWHCPDYKNGGVWECYKDGFTFQQFLRYGTSLVMSEEELKERWNERECVADMSIPEEDPND